MNRMVTLDNVKRDILTAVLYTPQAVKRFFKTEVGAYAEHDQFLGASVPLLRGVAQKHAALELALIQQILTSPYNEERLFALFVLIKQYQKGSAKERALLYEFYLANLAYVNNWNLVDCSAHLIVGNQLYDSGQTDLLYEFAASKNLWKKRVAIIATWYFIRQKQYELTCNIALKLAADTHDLIHKATGWMLREVGKKDVDVLRTFLHQSKHRFSRTTLRYATERMIAQDRAKLLKLEK
ncbi:DNA alkylation repair protein [bacterium]|nr:MAG: DNA alkylation repair protein [bacterium]QQR62200.1 MAG: DNA alkylation repair protein [bacterium]QQR63242.1 MAG: DNA alkylation repair protein [bacterium]